MLSHNESLSSVGGTVRDSALMNEVARQLRSLNVQVLIPEIYGPAGADNDAFKDSQFIQKLEDISSLDQTCTRYLADYPIGDATRNAVNALTGDIQSFEKTLTPAPPAAGANNGQPAGSANSPSHLAIVIAADQVAQKLFPIRGGSTTSQWQYVLWVQALESGGSVLHQSNFLGTKISFSGGAVDTYSLFRVDGQLACSGNVFNFQKPTRTNDLDKSFREQSKTDPSNPPFLRSTCANLPPIPSSAPAR
jgi:hypothetical protein